MHQSRKKNKQKTQGSTNKKKFKMPGTSSARAFQNVAMDIHSYFKKTLFTILWGSSSEHIASFFRVCSGRHLTIYSLVPAHKRSTRNAESRELEFPGQQDVNWTMDGASRQEASMTTG